MVQIPLSEEAESRGDHEDQYKRTKGGTIHSHKRPQVWGIQRDLQASLWMVVWSRGGGVSRYYSDSSRPWFMLTPISSIFSTTVQGNFKINHNLHTYPFDNWLSSHKETTRKAEPKGMPGVARRTSW